MLIIKYVPKHGVTVAMVLYQLYSAHIVKYIYKKKKLKLYLIRITFCRYIQFVCT